MATYTTNYNLKKPALADKIRIADFNGNSDTIDGAMHDNAVLGAQLKSDIGIVENTNTATHNISAGQYVIWKGDLYTASDAISSGATLSNANLTAVTGGGLNALNGNITTINGNIISQLVSTTLSTKCATGTVVSTFRVGRIVVITFYIITASNCVRDDVLATFDLPTTFVTNFFNTFSNGNLNLKTQTKTLVADGNIASGATIIGQMVGILNN